MTVKQIPHEQLTPPNDDPTQTQIPNATPGLGPLRDCDPDTEDLNADLDHRHRR
jgi:hypothetical protein